MSDEMDVVREIEKLIDDIFCGCDDCPHIGDDCIKCITALKEQLPDAVKREICKVLRKIRKKMGKSNNDSDVCLILDAIEKYSPAPKYCEGMQEAIDRGSVEKINGLWWMKSAFWREDKKIFDAYSMILKRCPVCKDGKNCIGGKG